MREIKFRAWFKDKKEMRVVAMSNVYKGNSYYLHLSPLPMSDYKEIELMQYTGLKDKNGKEIYEGDILLFNNDYPNAQKMEWKCVVKYRKGSFVCEYPKDGVYNHFDSWNVPKVTWEVIGNIFEDEHLLNSEKLGELK